MSLLGGRPGSAELTVDMDGVKYRFFNGTVCSVSVSHKTEPLDVSYFGCDRIRHSIYMGSEYNLGVVFAECEVVGTNEKVDPNEVEELINRVIRI